MGGSPRHSLTAAVAGHLAGATLLVVLAAVAFQAVGSLGDTDLIAEEPGDDPTAGADDAGDEPEDEASEVGDADEDEAEPQDADDEDDAGDGEDDRASDGTDDGDEPGSDGTDDEDAGADDGGPDEDAEPDDGADEGSDAAASIDPGEITVQVLDGYQQDGGAAADAVAEQLTAAGYDVVAQNPALRYEVTTVLWTSGNQDAARQVAAAIEADAVEPQPGTLSEEVAVHVVVGADRG